MSRRGAAAGLGLAALGAVVGPAEADEAQANRALLALGADVVTLSFNWSTLAAGRPHPVLGALGVAAGVASVAIVANEANDSRDSVELSQGATAVVAVGGVLAGTVGALAMLHSLRPDKAAPAEALRFRVAPMLMASDDGGPIPGIGVMARF